MSSPFLKIRIQVTPYIKKYIESVYGEALQVSYYNQLSMVVYAYLQKKKEYLLTKEEVEKTYPQLTNNIILLVRRNYESKLGIFLQPENHVAINKFFLTDFCKELHHHVMAPAYPAGYLIQDALQTFCSKHSIVIDEDITMDALVKLYYRHRQNISKYTIKTEDIFELP